MDPHAEFMKELSFETLKQFISHTFSIIVYLSLKRYPKSTSYLDITIIRRIIF